MSEHPKLIEDLIGLNGRAAALGEYEAAYHLLMAAIHVAGSSGDLPALERIAQVAERQEAELESLTPPHHLSRTEATKRGQTAVYASLKIHIDAVRLRIRSARQIERKAAAR
jgi:hypothetical protein